MLQYFKSLDVARSAALELPRLERLYGQMADGPEKRCLLRKIADIKEACRLTASPH